MIFGITGDLARQRTFPALHRLERRGLLRGPVIGVGRRELDSAALRQRARESIDTAAASPDREVLGALGDRLSYVPGDLDDPHTYELIERALGEARAPMFYLETPPALFAGSRPRSQGVPFLIRAGKRLPVTQTEVCLVFRRPPGPLFLPAQARERSVAPAQLVVRINQTPGIRFVLDLRGGGWRSSEPVRADTSTSRGGPVAARALAADCGGWLGLRLEAGDDAAAA